MNKIRVMLVDDQVLFVNSLKDVIEMRTDDIEVVGIALNGMQALELAEKANPKIVLMDVRMPGMDGVEACKKITERFPEIKIMMLTTFDDDEYVYDAIGVGAIGYLLKNIPPSELIDAIRAIHTGIVQLSSSVMKKLAAGRIHPGEGKSSLDIGAIKSVPKWFDELTRREKDILSLLVDGKNNREVADELYIAEQTVKNHLSVIYSKLQTRDRLQALNKVRDYFQVL